MYFKDSVENTTRPQKLFVVNVINKSNWECKEKNEFFFFFFFNNIKGLGQRKKQLWSKRHAKNI